MINKVTLIGRLGKDPEVRHFENNSVCNFTLATNEFYTDREGNRIEQTEWHNVAIWKKGLVDVAEKYLHKGNLVYIEGKLRTRSWDDQSGNKRYSTEVVVDSFKMLERREDADNTASSNTYQQEASPKAEAKQQSPAPQDNEPDEIADDLPF